MKDSIWNNLVAVGQVSGCRKSQRAAAVICADGDMFPGTNRPAVGVCDGSEECRRDCARICVHAEQSAILKAGSRARDADVYHLKVVGGIGVPSGPPSCVECSKLMLQAEITNVWLFHTDGWRQYAARDFHQLTLQALRLHETL